MAGLFGTDGIRGVANCHPMTPDIALQIGRAVADYFSKGQAKKEKRKPKIVIGKDTRLSGYMIEQALASGICSMGADVILVGPLPTPGVAYITHSMRADAGIMISASHNPYTDNGIKIFDHMGFKLDDQTEAEIEKLALGNSLTTRSPIGSGIGKAFRVDDAVGRYVVFLKSCFPSEMNLQGLRIALDCANGAAYKVAPSVFTELGAEVISIGAEPNGLNINQKCGSMYPENVSQAVKDYRADIGITLDGDADRVILSDERGEVVDGDLVLGLCAVDLKNKSGLPKNSVVATPMSNIGLERYLNDKGINMLRAPVGDRYVLTEMREKGLALGGEKSGHLIFLDYSTTGDGILGALRVLEVIKSTGKTLSELVEGIKLLPQVVENVKVSKKTPIDKLPDVMKSIEEAEGVLGKNGRVLVRYSGTEPIARVMLEGEKVAEIQVLARKIASTISRTVG